jgi:hypothetical protein
LSYGGQTALSLNNTATPLALPCHDIAASIITLSTLGFVIFFALPPIVALAWTYTKRTTGKDRLLDTRIRLTFALSNPKFITAFLILAVSYLITGVFASFYWITSAEWLITIGNYIEIANMISSIILIICLGFATKYASTSEINRELESAMSPEEELANKVDDLIKRFGAEEFMKKATEYLPNDFSKYLKVTPKNNKNKKKPTNIDSE